MYPKYRRLLTVVLLLAIAGVSMGVRRILVDDDLALSPADCELSLATTQASSLFVLGLSVVIFGILMAVRNDPNLRYSLSELTDAVTALVVLASITVIDFIAHDGITCKESVEGSASFVHNFAGMALIAAGTYVSYKIVKIFRKTGVI
jgi:hypothetical protein